MNDPTREEITRMSDESLDKFIESGPGPGKKDWDFAVEERQRRKLDRLANPHWVVWATFVVGAIAAIAAVILLFR